MENGWVKLHRKLIEKGYYKRSQYVHLWVHLLLIANHKPREFMFNGRMIMIKEGQMITGRKQLSEETGIPESTIEDILKFIESQQQIQQQKTTKYRLITILNWKDHQQDDRKSNNKPTTSRQQADTNKNVRIKELKKEENTNTAVAIAPAPFKWLEYLEKMKNHKARHIQVIAFYFEEKNIKFDTLKKAQTAIRRHLRSAKEASNFSDAELTKGIEKAKKDYPEYTIETITKILTR